MKESVLHFHFHITVVTYSTPNLSPWTIQNARFQKVVYQTIEVKVLSLRQRGQRFKALDSLLTPLSVDSNTTVYSNE